METRRRAYVGMRTYRQGLGIFSITPEETKSASRKGVLARGRVLWSDEEKQYLWNLCTDSAYQHSSGIFTGCPSYREISAALDRRFGNSRNRRSLQTMALKLRKEKGERPTGNLFKSL